MEPGPSTAARSATPQTPHGATRTLHNKVPEITLYFWIIKILCTTVGETVSDFLNVDLKLGLNGTGIVMGLFLAGSLVLQFRYRKYTPWVYWLVVVLVSVVGTIITDKLHDDLGYDLKTLTIVFSVLLAGVFGLWFSAEKTLSIRTIYTRRREGFYWAAILATFALGTAAGDYLLETLQDRLGDNREGLLLSGAVFGLIIVGAGVAHLALKTNPVLTFWIAYIFTRPFGANIGDFLGGNPQSVIEDGEAGVGGLGLGPELVSVIFLVAIVLAIVYLTKTKKDATPDPRFVVETQAERALHVSAPAGEHHVVLLEEDPHVNRRRYEIRDRKQRAVRFSGEELQSIAMWWQNEATRIAAPKPGERVEEPR